MFIKEIELNNFRIYYGLNKISLLPIDDKNVIIVSGLNGYGKTTFLMSLVWCLYGKQMKQVDDLYAKEISDKCNYARYIKDSLNRLAEREGHSKFSVTITFTDVKASGISCNEVKIKRSYNIMATKSESLEILLDGQPYALSGELNEDELDEKEMFIRDYILPMEIAKFFFFDAEKITNLAEETSNEGNAQLSRAYSEVLGIQKYVTLKESLNILLDNYRTKAANMDDQKNFNQIEADLKNNDIEQSKNKEETESLNEEINSLRKDIEDIQAKLIREGDKMSADDLSKLKSEKSEKQSRLDVANSSLKEIYDYLPFALAGETVAEISEQLQKEKKSKETTYQKEDVNRKIDAILTDIENDKNQSNISFDANTFKVKNFYEREIEKLIKKHFFANLCDYDENINPLHDFTDPQRNEFNQLVAKLKTSVKDKFAQVSKECSSLRNEIDRISRKLKDAESKEESPFIADLRKKKDEKEQILSEKMKTAGVLENKLKSLEDNAKALKQRREELRKRIDESVQFSEKEKETKKLVEKLTEFISRYQDEKKRSLEEKMLASLQVLMHKKDFVNKVEVNITTDFIDMNLLDAQSHSIDKSSLSKGEKQLYASALLYSLVDESNIEFPVFIDSPMQKFDEKHSENIVRNFYPNVSKQVVLFPLLNKELTQKEYNVLKNKISRTYLINNIQDGVHSEFKEIEPEDLFTTFNKTYNAD